MALRSTYTATLNGGPKVLLWGDAAGMRALSDFLRKMLIVPRLITTVMVVTKSEIYCQPCPKCRSASPETHARPVFLQQAKGPKSPRPRADIRCTI